MAIDPSEEITFEAGRPGPAAEAVADVVDGGSGWVNLAPESEPGEPPPRRNLFAAIFSSRGPVMPLITVSTVDQAVGRLGLGLQHGGGPSALSTLAGAGHPLPDGWQKVADHPRRGLVVSAPDTTSAEVLVDWLLGAAELLTEQPLSGRWVARVYRP